MANKPSLSYIYLTAAVILCLIIAPLFQQGLFIDGLLYKTVATNYAHGDNGFWGMKFSDVSMNPFYEQPPLFFFVTGVLFKVMGTSFVADKLITLFFLLASVFFLYKICRFIFKEITLFHIVILQVLSVPVFCWAFSNQVIETLVLPLTLLAFYAFLIYRLRYSNLINMFCLFSFTFSVFLLFLTKGFQSCFIIVAPFLYFIVLKERRALYFSLFSGSMLALFLYLIVYVHPPAAEWYNYYFQKRLLASLNGVGATTDFRGEIIIRTFTELAIPLLLLLAIFTYRKMKGIKNKITQNRKKTVLVLFLIGVFGSFPFAITLEQRGFYLVPAFPFFILAFTLLFINDFTRIIQFISKAFEKKAMEYSLLTVFLCAFAYFTLSPKLYKRDENLINDLKLIKPYLKTGDTISIDGVSWNDTPLQAYLYMMNKVNVEGNYNHNYYIVDRGHKLNPDSSFNKVNIATKQYDLFVKK